MAVRDSPTRQQPRDTACPTCGAPAERGQLVCLECGSRVALSYRRPPSWKLPVAIVAIIGVLALGGAVLAYNAIDDEARDEVSATPPAPKKPAAKKPAAGDAKNQTAAERKAAADKRAADRRASERQAAERRAADNASPSATGGLVKRGKLYSWPRTLEGFTVVLLSAEDRQSATGFANEVADKDSAKTGVITSDDFSSLPQGFFIVFGGLYKTRERADQAVARLSGAYPGAFAQVVKR